MPSEDPLNILAIADPELAQTVRETLKGERVVPDDDTVKTLVDETLWGLMQEPAFGQAIAGGLLRLIPMADPERLATYRRIIRDTAKEGPTYGKILADHLATVLVFGDNGLLPEFTQTVAVMKQKGTYTLKGPLQCLDFLLNEHDVPSALIYLALLRECFSKDLRYNASLHLTYVLPRAVQAFPAEKRCRQTEQFLRLMRVDERLVDPFLNGLDKGLGLLAPEALTTFLSRALERYQRNPKLGMRFLALESQTGMDFYSTLQVTVSFNQIRNQMNRYVQARTGQSVSVKALSSIPSAGRHRETGQPAACSNGKNIFLPDEIGWFPEKKKNIALYKYLVKLESALYEFGTFDFDLDRLRNITDPNNTLPLGPEENCLSDMERFCGLFPIRPLAADLFCAFEHGRLNHLLFKRYPGMVQSVCPLFRKEADRLMADDSFEGTLLPIYIILSLDLPDASLPGPPAVKHLAKAFRHRFLEMLQTDPTVTTAARMVTESYTAITRFLNPQGYTAMPIPFNRRLRPDLFTIAHLDAERMAALIKSHLQKKGVRVYTSEIRKRYIANNGRLTPDDIRAAVISPENGLEATAVSSTEMRAPPVQMDPALFDVTDLLGDKKAAAAGEDPAVPAHRYREWDYRLGDYLFNHVHVREKPLVGSTNGFYRETLARYRGLIKRIRHSFELLKPEGLTLLRQWIEGDEFDYRALLDFALDRRAGITPSDRLFIKRIKQIRDVAVLLLVDASRSTANAVPGSRLSVMDVEKEAIVLFCEALNIVGDSFSIAAFSGTGRLGVDYFPVKAFDEILGSAVRQKIGAMAPQRSTRMGAAIRHATRQLEAVAARVRLLIIIGDGFPNDLDYKGDYAIEDTRKAILEARSQYIHSHAITVNLAGDPRLDELYGNIHHSVIADVRELPDRLIGIYGSLTRN